MIALESHPALHYATELACYHVGLLANVLAGAHITTRSNMNSVQTVKQYFTLRAIPLFVRWVACLALFLMVWENPHVNFLDKYLGSLPTHMGFAIGFGFLSDAFWDKFIVIVLPGIQKSLPAVPDAANPNPPS